LATPRERYASAMESTTSQGLEEQRLRREVLAMREALETLDHDRSSAVAELHAQHRAAIEELQATVRRLRTVMDELRAAHEEAIQQQRRQLQSEIRELQVALAHTRAAFDEERIAIQGRHQEELLAAGRIRLELEATVRRLREQIDGNR
jgi:phage host-nuclease inhibitor protein Gam